MSNKKYDLAVYIGRFQPFHNGHLSVVNRAKEVADKVLVLVGSANASISAKNPLAWGERAELIQRSVTGNVEIQPLDDYTYEENQWITDIQEAVGTGYKKVCLIGHTKDTSSYYLNNFPQWDLVDVEYYNVIDATHIRTLMYEGKFDFIRGVVPKPVFKRLEYFADTERYTNVVAEYEYIKKYKKDWEAAPYPPTLHTVDAVVIQSGHILLIQRKEQPGVGLWAMPGGFLEITETLLDGCIRELKEETKLKVPEPVLRGRITKQSTFDNPDRSQRGRTITTAFLIQLDDTQSLPKVKANDDAKEAKWIPLSEFYDMATLMVEDHFHIIRKMVDNI